MRRATERLFPGNSDSTLGDGAERPISLLAIQVQGAREVRSKNEGHRCRGEAIQEIINLGLTTCFAVFQSMEEVALSLVDDALVQCDKICSSICTYSGV